MKFLISFVLWCACSTGNVLPKCNHLTISDANPIQFWPSTDSTYNETEVCSIEPACFCQVFECTDDITLQFEATTGLACTLFAKDVSGAELLSYPIEEIMVGVYQLSFIPTLLCGEKIQFIIEGLSFTERTESQSNQWFGVAYGNGVFVAVSVDGTNRVMTSPDGITWTNRTASDASNWTSITYGNGVFVAVAFSGAGYVVMTSPNGITLTNRTAAGFNSWLGVTYGNGRFVAVANSGSGNRAMYSTDNGVTWAYGTTSNYSWQSVAYGNGLFVAVAVGNHIMTSPNGITWTDQTPPAGVTAWKGVSFGNNLFVAVASAGSEGGAMYSSDGITWRYATSAPNYQWYSVVYGNGLFVAVDGGSVKKAMYSIDGITWITFTTPLISVFNSITYGNGTFVAVAQPSGPYPSAVMSSSFESLKSDCVEIKSEADCTELIHYSNSNDFADQQFANTSPTGDFYIRIPAVFFHESFPEEQESIDLSNSQTVQLRSELKAKKQFEVGYMPYYMHRKLQLVLAHDSVSIQGKKWIRVDGYQLETGNKRYPLKMAKVMLTDKDYIQRNVL